MLFHFKRTPSLTLIGNPLAFVHPGIAKPCPGRPRRQKNWRIFNFVPRVNAKLQPTATTVNNHCKYQFLSLPIWCYIMSLQPLVGIQDRCLRRQKRWSEAQRFGVLDRQVAIAGGVAPPSGSDHGKPLTGSDLLQFRPLILVLRRKGYI